MSERDELKYQFQKVRMSSAKLSIHMGFNSFWNNTSSKVAVECYLFLVYIVMVFDKPLHNQIWM